ncbi:MAG: peptidoglycan-binding domain-containing protein [Cyclobacteriaceae bacterium]
MKNLLIIALVIFLGLFGYFKYQNYKRFRPPSVYDYTASEDLDVQYHDPSVTKAFYQESTELGTLARKIWANKKIDVLHPEEDDIEAETYASQYTDKLAHVRYLEGILINSKKLKDQGFNNQEIQEMELKGISPKDYKFQKGFENADFNLGEGDEGQIVAMVQQELVNQGYEIPVDGKFRALTRQAVIEIQRKSDLFPTGTIDKHTLKAIMKK